MPNHGVAHTTHYGVAPGRGYDDRRRGRNRREYVDSRADVVLYKDALPRGHNRRGPDRRAPLMTQTFSGIPNSLRGLAIGRKGAIQKLVTGRGARDVGFMLERYSVEDDTIADYFKIVIRGTARDVLCAQRFIFNHVSASYKKAGPAVLPTGSRVVWTYDDELKSFVAELKASARGQSVRSFLRECRARPVAPVLPTDDSFAQEDADDAKHWPEHLANPYPCPVLERAIREYQSMGVPPPADTGARPGSPAYSPTSPTYDPEAGLDASSADECNIADCDECAQHRREAERVLGETLPPDCVRTQAWVAEGGLAAWIAPVPQDNE